MNDAITGYTTSLGSQGLMKAPTQALAPVDDYQVLGLPSPNQMEALKSFCRDMSGTPFLPPSLVANKSPEQRAGILLAVILTGKEMGLLPMFCLRAFWLSPDGRLGMYADAMLAVMRSHGVKFKWPRNENAGVQVEAARDDESYLAEFTWDDAVRAGLTNKNTWKAYPKAMCRARTISEIFRALCADMGGTQMYSQEELIDMEPEVDEKGDTRYVQADKAAEEDPSLSIKPKAQESTSRLETEAPAAETVTAQAAPIAAKPETITPKAETKPVDPDAEAYKETLSAIRVLVPGLKKSHPTEWLAGWYGELGRKLTAKECADAIKTLHDVLASFPAAADELLVNPREMGAKMRQRMAESADVPDEIDNEAAEPADESDPIAGVPNSLIAQTFGWDAQTCAIASKVIRDRAKVNGDEQAVVNALNGFGFKGMTVEDAVALLTMYAYDTDAFLLRRKGEAKKIGPAKLLVMVEDVLKKPMTDFQPGSPEPVAAMTAVMSGL